MSRPRGRPAADDLLTPGEWAVVEGVRHGLSNPAIARLRGVTVDAVKFHVTNALQKLGLSKRGQLRHWPGIRKHSALAQQETPLMDTHTQLGPIGQISRSVKHVEAARRWYEDSLGLTHLYSFGTMAFFDCGGTRLLLSQQDGQASDSILYFRVDDVRVSHAALSSRGVEFIDAPHLIHRHPDGTEEWMSFFKDNEGRPLALMSQHRGKPA